MRITRTDDFEVSGNGSSANWNKAQWAALAGTKNGLPYETKVKLLYSKTGLYVLTEASDRTITASLDDFQNLWTQDVFEVFLWPDERYTTYFEYEISPLGKELPILIPNFEGKFLGWRPWKYEGNRKIRKATTAKGGTLGSGASVTGWQAEFFIPNELLQPLQNVPPKPGTRWRANFYRMDYDEGKKTSWQWAEVGSSFHEFNKFGTLIFE